MKIETAKARGRKDALTQVKDKLLRKLYYVNKKVKVCKNPYNYLELHTEHKVLMRCIQVVDWMLEADE